MSNLVSKNFSKKNCDKAHVALQSDIGFSFHKLWMDIVMKITDYRLFQSKK